MPSCRDGSLESAPAYSATPIPPSTSDRYYPSLWINPPFPTSLLLPSRHPQMNCLSTTPSSFFFFFFSLLINTDRITVDTYYARDGAIYSALRLNLFAFESRGMPKTRNNRKRGNSLEWERAYILYTRA